MLEVPVTEMYLKFRESQKRAEGDVKRATSTIVKVCQQRAAVQVGRESDALSSHFSQKLDSAMQTLAGVKRKLENMRTIQDNIMSTCKKRLVLVKQCKRMTYRSKVTDADARSYNRRHQNNFYF